MPHSRLRRAIIPTPRQPDVDEEETDTGSPRWSWTRLLKSFFARDMARCPWCQRGALGIIAVITHGEVIRKILWHLKCAVDTPPLPQRVSAKQSSPSPPPDCTWGIPPRPRQPSSGPEPVVPLHAAGE